MGCIRIRDDDGDGDSSTVEISEGWGHIVIWIGSGMRDCSGGIRPRTRIAFEQLVCGEEGDVLSHIHTHTFHFDNPRITKEPEL